MISPRSRRHLSINKITISNSLEILNKLEDKYLMKNQTKAKINASKRRGERDEDMYCPEPHPFNPFSCLICTLLWLKEKNLYSILQNLCLSMHSIGTLCTLIIPKWDVSVLETAL
jgi:hypothetical protein